MSLKFTFFSLKFIHGEEKNKNFDCNFSVRRVIIYFLVGLRLTFFKFLKSGGLVKKL